LWGKKGKGLVVWTGGFRAEDNSGQASHVKGRKRGQGGTERCTPQKKLLRSPAKNGKLRGSQGVKKGEWKRSLEEEKRLSFKVILRDNWGQERPRKGCV